MDLAPRTRAAVLAGQAVAEVSRRTGRGEGSVIGGRIALAVDPAALGRLALGRDVVLVTGTNGKTTTTRLLAAALATSGSVASNATGSNLLPGLVGALWGADRQATAALEVDEGLLVKAARETQPAVVVLLNLSRDQLDRIGEVRSHAASWRGMLAANPSVTAVANADDPLVAWAAEAAGRKVWVGTGQQWREDATSCPACGGRITWDEEIPAGAGSAGAGSAGAGSAGAGSAGAGSAWAGSAWVWACTSCVRKRPVPDVWLETDELLLAGHRLPIALQLPGRCNLANAAMAAAAAELLGCDPRLAVQAMSDVGTVAGRYQHVAVDGVDVRLLLAKNPAGWSEALQLIRPAPLPVVVGINARVADGRDPSWLWDVPFERLRGREVVATGDRAHDLAVRLRYADVTHSLVTGYSDAVLAAGGPEVDLAANYTSFQDARRELGGRGR